MRWNGAIWSSDQMPASWGVMRPRGSTAVASAMTKPAPPTARDPRWTRCQSVTNPSSELYWHIGLTPTRLRNVTPLIVYGSKRCDIGWWSTFCLLNESYNNCLDGLTGDNLSIYHEKLALLVKWLVKSGSRNDECTLTRPLVLAYSKHITSIQTEWLG